MGVLYNYRNSIVGAIMFVYSVYTVYNTAYCPMVYALIVSAIGWILCCCFRQKEGKIRLLRYIIWICLLYANNMYADYILKNCSVESRGDMVYEMLSGIVIAGIMILFAVLFLKRAKQDVVDDINYSKEQDRITKERIKNNPTGCPKCGSDFQLYREVTADTYYEFQVCPNCGYRRQIS